MLGRERETPCLGRETPFKADAMFGEGKGDAMLWRERETLCWGGRGRRH